METLRARREGGTSGVEPLPLYSDVPSREVSATAGGGTGGSSVAECYTWWEQPCITGGTCHGRELGDRQSGMKYRTSPVS